MKLAELLRSRQIPGTFYIPITPYRGSGALDHAELRTLSSGGFEIGAHGYSHKHLWKLSPEELAKEINPCKPALEDILGTEVRMFCYPRGRYDSNAMRIVREAGYWGARTVRLFATRPEFNPFELPTTLQAVPNPRLGYIKNLARARKMESVRLCFTHATKLGNWVQLGKSLFDSVLQYGGIWHLWGHSWELEKFGLWKDLEEMLDYVGGRSAVKYVPNCEVVRLSSMQAN